ncbi:pyridoxamine 5'-phosphate oxidase family protein [Rothia halotolerans]|uniref:pyridoxamine 5'-phosphate oxidase family protein n=1 Tax=Rothia halotolerans TaxID=405770 RepID=UPI0013EBABF5|nr:pyridoxamine 5'-phosphate oxidase family protein [Rothia halotolerans]
MTKASEAVLEEIWRSLHAATARHTPFTLGYLGTVDAEGAPRVRAVILRRVDREWGELALATDRRSAKVSEIAGNPRVALTVYDEERSVQQRIEGRARLDDSAERERVWVSLGSHSRDLYRSPWAPGTILPAEAGDDVEPRPAETHAEAATDDAAAFERFAWVRIECERLDWLDLSASPQERWEFRRGADEWEGQRIVP